MLGKLGRSLMKNSRSKVKRVPPSVRISELHEKNRSMNPHCVEDGLLLGLAIVRYLDEQHAAQEKS